MKRFPVMIFVVVAVASCAFAQDSTYGNCNYGPEMTVTDICKVLHPAEKGAVNVIGIAACRGMECFEKRDGFEIKIVVVGKTGEFPKTWHAWVTPQGGKLDATKYTGDQCILPDKDKDGGTGVQKIGTTTQLSTTRPIRCKAEREVDDYLYHEHFASNETSKCLAWIECREDLPKN